MKAENMKCIKFAEVVLLENRQVLLLCSYCNKEFDIIGDFTKHLAYCSRVQFLFKASVPRLEFDGTQLLRKAKNLFKQFEVYQLKEDFLNAHNQPTKCDVKKADINNIYDMEDVILEHDLFELTKADVDEALGTRTATEQTTYDELIQEITPYVQFKENVHTTRSPAATNKNFSNQQQSLVNSTNLNCNKNLNGQAIQSSSNVKEIMHFEIKETQQQSLVLSNGKEILLEEKLNPGMTTAGKVQPRSQRNLRRKTISKKSSPSFTISAQAMEENIIQNTNDKVENTEKSASSYKRKLSNDVINRKKINNYLDSKSPKRIKQTRNSLCNTQIDIKSGNLVLSKPIVITVPSSTAITTGQTGSIDRPTTSKLQSIQSPSAKLQNVSNNSNRTQTTVNETSSLTYASTSIEPTKDTKTTHILNKLQNLGLQIKRTTIVTTHPTSAVAQQDDKAKETLALLQKLQSKGMKVKVLSKPSNTMNSSTVASSVNRISSTSSKPSIATKILHSNSNMSFNGAIMNSAFKQKNLTITKIKS